MIELKVEAAENRTGAKEKLWGSFIGFVRDTADPERRGRVRFYCPEVMGDRDHSDHWLPWALPKMPLAGFDQGVFLVPPSPSDDQRDPEGTPRSPLRQVAYWIEFRQGDVRFPIYTGGFWFAEGDLPNSAPSLSDGSRGGDETTAPPTGAQQVRAKTVSIVDGEASVSLGEPVSEPPPATEAQYPQNRFYKSSRGHVIEVDDTPGAERIRIFHRQGSYLEYDASGSCIEKTVGNSFAYMGGSQLVTVVGDSLNVYQGALREQVAGERQNVVSGPYVEVIEGVDRRFSQVSLEQTVGGIWVVKSASAVIEALASMELAAGEGLSLAGQDINAVSMTSMNLRCPTGVHISGLLVDGTAGALYDTVAVAGSLAIAAGTFAVQMATPGGVIDAASVPTLAAALSSFVTAVTLAFTIPANFTQHLVAR